MLEPGAAGRSRKPKGAANHADTQRLEHVRSATRRAAQLVAAATRPTATSLRDEMGSFRISAFAERLAGWVIPYPAFNAAFSAYTECIGGVFTMPAHAACLDSNDDQHAHGHRSGVLGD